jgi:hypothetical protein
MSVRQDILDRIAVDLRAVPAIKEVFINRTMAVDIETASFPCAFVYSGNVTRLLSDNRSVIGYENWEWLVPIEVWGKDQDMEVLLATLHAALFDDEKLNGLAVTSYITGVDMLTLDVDRHIEAMLIQYTVVFRHARGVP